MHFPAWHLQWKEQGKTDLCEEGAQVTVAVPVAVASINYFLLLESGLV